MHLSASANTFTLTLTLYILKFLYDFRDPSFGLAPTLTTPIIIDTSTNYSSALTTSSSAYSRIGSSGTFYYETIEVITTLTGNYSFLSSSAIDTFGYLYLTPINPLDLTANLLTFNDDNGGNSQFLFTYNLQAGNTYIVIFTTYGPTSTGPFSLEVYGPSRVSLRRINLSLGISTTTPSTSEYDGILD